MEKKKISKGQFKSKALEIMRDVEETGDEVIITDNGKPSVKIIKFEPKEVDIVEEMQGSVLFYEDPCEPVGVEDWEALK